MGFKTLLTILASICIVVSGCQSKKELNNIKYQGNVIVLISEDTRPIVNYYLEEKNPAPQARFILKENKNDIWEIGSNEAENGKVYQISHQQIEGRYIYARRMIIT